MSYIFIEIQFKPIISFVKKSRLILNKLKVVSYGILIKWVGSSFRWT